MGLAMKGAGKDCGWLESLARELEMGLARFGDGAYADLTGGAIPARALVWRATEGWEAEVFDYDRASPRGLQRIWGPEAHPDRAVAMRAAEAAARNYAADQKTPVEWVEFR